MENSGEQRAKKSKKDNAEAQSTRSFAKKRNPRAQPGMAVPQECEYEKRASNIGRRFDRVLF